MSLQKLTSNFSAYNTWANTLLVEWLLSLDMAVLYQKSASSFDSIDSTIQHMLRVQKFWAAFISEEDLSRLDWKVFENQAERLLRELQTQSQTLEQTVAGFSEQQLLEELNLDMPWAKNKLPRYEYIIHLSNHSTYHRGQIVTVARSLGINSGIPATDYNFYNSKNK